jgi:ABC-type multidrug transport system ATPase subunit
MQLEIRNLSKTYPNGVKALTGVTLDIPRGMFGLLGPNGAGKSTLMRTIATLQDPDEGTNQLGELEVLKHKGQVRAMLGYLPQDFGVYPTVSAEDMLDHFAVLKGITRRKERKAVVQALLQRTNLYEVRKKKLGGYSGGMKQRFGIAQALLGDPKLIIVDEPTAGLDPAERNRFHNLLSEIGEHVVVILSTHIVDDVSDLCTNMAIMADGRVLLAKSPRDAIAEMAGTIWKKLVARAELASYQERFNVISSRLFAGRLKLHVHSDARPDESFEPVDTTLEDVYFTTLARAQDPDAARAA